MPEELDKNGHEAELPHTCPFAVEIGEDSEALCNCCEECTRECLWEI